MFLKMPFGPPLQQHFIMTDLTVDKHEIPFMTSYLDSRVVLRVCVACGKSSRVKPLITLGSFRLEYLALGVKSDDIGFDSTCGWEGFAGVLGALLMPPCQRMVISSTDRATGKHF